MLRTDGRVRFGRVARPVIWVERVDRRPPDQRSRWESRWDRPGWRVQVGPEHMPPDMYRKTWRCSPLYYGRVSPHGAVHVGYSRSGQVDPNNCGVPRDFGETARELLERVREELIQTGELYDRRRAVIADPAIAIARAKAARQYAEDLVERHLDEIHSHRRRRTHVDDVADAWEVAYDAAVEAGLPIQAEIAMTSAQWWRSYRERNGLPPRRARVRGGHDS